jgi:dolichol-phosphate mannosyltransferase
MTGGYRAFTAEALDRIDLDAVLSQGYCFQIDMLWHAQVAGMRIREVPITFPERERGSSKMSGAIVVEAMARVTGWAVASLPARMRRAAVKRAEAVDSRS